MERVIHKEKKLDVFEKSFKFSKTIFAYFFRWEEGGRLRTVDK